MRQASADVLKYRQKFSNTRQYLRLNYIAEDNLTLDELVQRGDIVQESSPYIDSIIETVEKEIGQFRSPVL